MAYQDAANYNKLKSMKGLPIGAIIPWPGSQDTIPGGWVLCNGTAIPYDRYPLLYDTIGNIYGGVAGSTFKVPDLLSTNAAIMDIFQGHFSYLKNAEIQHRPENDNINEDEFWSTIGKSDNGNSGSDVTQNHNTTVDVVGEQTSKPDIVARYGEFTLSTGTADTIINVLERKTTDVHLPSHGHSYEAENSPSYGRKNKGATLCTSVFGGDGYCYVAGSCTNVSRSTNDPPKSGTEMSSVGASKTVGTSWRSGGGNIINDGPQYIQYASTGFSNGDGDSGGDMYAHISGNKYFFSSLSNDEKSISGLAGHRHGTIDLKFESKVKVLNPGIVNDVKINTVKIDNDSGKAFCSLNMDSATPTLGMSFIIRAY
jgi:hypothetical protein